MQAHPSCVSAAPLGFVPSADLLRVHFVPAARLLWFGIFITWPSFDLQGTSLWTGLQLVSVLLTAVLGAQQPRQFSVQLTAHFSSPHFAILLTRPSRETERLSTPKFRASTATARSSHPIACHLLRRGYLCGYQA